MKDYIKSIEDGERRFFSEDVSFRKKEDGSDDENVIEGYAAVFDKPSQDFGGWEERIAKGAFAQVLNDDALALFNHDINLVLGRNKVNVALSEDERGLKYVITLPNTTFAKDLRTLIHDKIIRESSFAFSVAEQEWYHAKDQNEKSVRTIKKVRRLYDVSPVSIPAYKDTTVASRSFTESKKSGKGEPVMSLELMEMKIKLNQTSL